MEPRKTECVSAFHLAGQRSVEVHSQVSPIQDVKGGNAYQE